MSKDRDKAPPQQTALTKQNTSVSDSLDPPRDRRVSNVIADNYHEKANGFMKAKASDDKTDKLGFMIALKRTKLRSGDEIPDRPVQAHMTLWSNSGERGSVPQMSPAPAKSITWLEDLHLCHLNREICILPPLLGANR